MTILAATCATLAAIVTTAQPGDTVKLTGTCGVIEINAQPSGVVTINADRASVAGLRFYGAANISWVGGVIRAKSGMGGAAADGYAIHVRGSRRIAVREATVTEARIGAVVLDSDTVTFKNNAFLALRMDGITASLTRGLTISNNRFADFRPNPSTCTSPEGVVTYGVAARDCVGTWDDGDHPDAVQLRNGVVRAVLEWNQVFGKTQGLTQMATTGDAPLQNVIVRWNHIETSTYHPITLGACNECVIRENVVRRAPGSLVKSIILKGLAARCGNEVQDDAPDGVCSTS